MQASIRPLLVETTGHLQRFYWLMTRSMQRTNHADWCPVEGKYVLVGRRKKLRDGWGRRVALHPVPTLCPTPFANRDHQAVRIGILGDAHAEGFSRLL